MKLSFATVWKEVLEKETLAWSSATIPCRFMRAATRSAAASRLSSADTSAPARGGPADSVSLRTRHTLSASGGGAVRWCR